MGSVNGLWHLRFVYDPAERLTNVFDSGSSQRPVQVYSYLPPDDSSAYGKGRLNRAILYNYSAGLTNITVVTEIYKYASPSGRPSERDTLVENVNGTTRTTLQSTVQNFTYDSLGAISQLDDPTCSPACSGLAITGPTYTHKNGALTAVSSYAPAITYNADGSLFEVAHNASGSIKDTYTPDNSGMSRPGLISLTGISGCTAPQIAQGISNKQVASGSPANLAVSATSASTPPLTYVWLKDGAIIPGETTFSCCTAPVTASATYTGRISNSCGQAESTAMITVCGNPSIGTQPQNGTYTGTPVTLTVSANGCGTLTFQWYIGISPSGTAISGATSPSYPASPTVTTQYWVRVTDSVGGFINSNTAAVTVPTPLPTPGALTATLTLGSNTIVVTWGASTGADHYQLQRMDHGVWSTFDVNGTSISYGLTAGATYIFHVRAVDSGGGSASPYTANDLATTMPFALVQAGVTTVGFSQFDQIRTAINAVRMAHNDAALSWRQILDAAYPGQNIPEPASNAVILAKHLLALRFAMNAALDNVQVATWAYTDSLSSPTVIKAVHITQLQQRAQ